jgi:hypothetical protein
VPFAAYNVLECLGRSFPMKKAPLMQIQFRHDVDKVLEEAKEQTKPAILDFSAAPM